MRNRNREPHQHAIWCGLCLRNHTFYPTPCRTCDDRYHFAPGITEIDHLEILARISEWEYDSNRTLGTVVTAHDKAVSENMSATNAYRKSDGYLATIARVRQTTKGKP